MRFAFIQAEKATVPLAHLCQILNVSRSGFYAWQTRPESPHARRDRQLGVLVRASFDASRRRYGSPRIHEESHRTTVSGEPEAGRAIDASRRAEGAGAQTLQAHHDE